MASAAQEVVVKLITLSCVGTSDEEDAAKALADLAFNEDNQVAKAGGITPLISLARSGTDGQKYWAARALEHLAINADNKVAIHITLVAHLNTLGAVPLTLPPVPVWALAGTLR